MKHDLKIWPQYFHRIMDGSKTFEIRENDRGFQSGDLVCLREWNPEINEYDTDPMGGSMNVPKGYTGEEANFKIGYIHPLEHNRVVFSLIKQES